MISSSAEETLLLLLLEIGIAIVFSLLTARILGSRGVPQVLGLIAGGIFLQFLSTATLQFLGEAFPSPPGEAMIYIITTGALGYIGYGIGSHLDMRKLREESTGLVMVLSGTVFGSFTLVFIATFLFFQEFTLALILASIAVATAPASTSEVIAEYRAEGPIKSNSTLSDCI